METKKQKNNQIKLTLDFSDLVNVFLEMGKKYLSSKEYAAYKKETTLSFNKWKTKQKKKK